MQDFDALLFEPTGGRYPACRLPADARRIKLVGKARLRCWRRPFRLAPRLLIAEVEANDPGDLRAADAGAADRQGRRL